MKTIRTPADLRQFGINPLTGEACKLSMRVLCDLSAEGVEYVIEFLGLPVGTQLCENWNTTVDNAPAVACIMLTSHAMVELGVFILRKTHNLVVDCGSGEYRAFNYGDKHSDAYVEMALASDRMVYRNEAPADSSRNQHQMTGRTV